MSLFITVIAALSLTLSANAQAFEKLQGDDLVSGKKVTIESVTKKGLVVVFLSTVCPCSQSHVSELKQLKKDFPEFEFVAVHSNAEEPAELTRAYFQKADLPFPVVQDKDFAIANQFGALKTPHAFVLNSLGQTVYRGGVSNSKRIEGADRKFLREALQDVQDGHPVRTASARSLGCTISRHL